ILLSFRAGFRRVSLCGVAGLAGRQHSCISLAAYEAAYEEFNFSMASSIAIVMGIVQLAVVLVALGVRQAAYRGPASGGKRSEEHTSELQSLMRISYAVF